MYMTSTENIREPISSASTDTATQNQLAESRLLLVYMPVVVLTKVYSVINNNINKKQQHPNTIYG